MHESDFEQLRRLLASDGTEIEFEQRNEGGPYAGLEWLLPTAVILFIGKAYIDGFVKEIGKDHYALLKQGLKSLYARLVGPRAPALTIVSTAGKSGAKSPYSLLFSLLAEAPDGLCFKLLIKASATEAEYDATVNAFIAFLDAFHNKALPAEVVQELQAVRVVGKTLLLAYDPIRGRVVAVDPIAERVRPSPDLHGN
ncbi:hypothetical protein DBV14_03550 [Variovorax sp. KBW07]|uniref:hypothetical protein n=1 Tax=Variovorax sp. KBW07 TaxID=2153358 RepID=UPI000F569D92|nr:hypothetical protein [Variovorax sp. KBW07]RQO62858.1 hypothetical protein DBV14_03550 [Variovorax sp. KBW07]